MCLTAMDYPCISPKNVADFQLLTDDDETEAHLSDTVMATLCKNPSLDCALALAKRNLLAVDLWSDINAIDHPSPCPLLVIKKKS